MVGNYSCSEGQTRKYTPHKVARVLNKKDVYTKLMKKDIDGVKAYLSEIAPNNFLDQIKYFFDEDRQKKYRVAKAILRKRTNEKRTESTKKPDSIESLV